MNYNRYLDRDYLSLTPQRKRRAGARVLRAAAVVIGIGALAGGMLLGGAHVAEAMRQAPESHTSGPLEVPLTVPGQATAGTTAIAEPAPAAAASHDTTLASLEVEPAAPSPLTAPEPPVPTLAPPSPQPLAGPIAWRKVKVERGDNLSLIFDRVGLTPQQLYAVMSADDENKALTRLSPGQALEFDVRDGQLHGLRYRKSALRTLTITREGERFITATEAREVERRLAQANGTIASSLYIAGQQAGLSDKTIMELAGVFGWDIDFALDIRKGDSFTVLYEQEFLDDSKLRDGTILAAEFVNQGRVVRAVRYTDPNGHTDYYTPDGFSMRKAFLRSPVDFRRISSRFQPERWHPVLGKKRPHRGVDYAAAVGTPIKAAGEGKVIFRGWKGGYGRTVVIQHGQRYSTLYAHMSRFASSVTNGSRVKQGQVVGYVGASGLATGPHLHYEFRVDGVHRNPLTVKLPDASPVPKNFRQDFDGKASQLIARLEEIKGTQVVLAE